MDSYKTRCTFLLVSILLMLSSLTTSDDSKDKEECTESLVGLATCLPYVGGNAKAPTPDCCSGLKQVLKTNKKCLCVVIKDRNDPDLSLNINVTLALSLPQVCNAPANISQCPELLHLPPDSPDAQVFYQFGQKTTNRTASSPVAGGPNASVGANTTPGSGGEQKSGCPCNGKKWLGWEIIVGMVLLWAFTSNLFM